LPAIGSITNSPTSSPNNFSDSDPKWCKQCTHITSCRNYLAWFVSLAHFSPAKRQWQPIPNLGANPFASFALLNCFPCPSSSACPDHNTVSRAREAIFQLLLSILPYNLSLSVSNVESSNQCCINATSRNIFYRKPSRLVSRDN
jgi:hypothetical protein